MNHTTESINEEKMKTQREREREFYNQILPNIASRTKELLFLDFGKSGRA